MVNKYFNSFSEENEQNLVQTLIDESIQIFGFDVYYLPKTQNNTNTILGEDTTSTYTTSYAIEMYLENVEGFEGDKNFLSNLGLNIRKNVNLLVSNNRFIDVVRQGPFNIPNPTINLDQTIRPLEGDLIYFPLTKGLFTIKFADHEAVFYQLGKIYVWRLTCEMFQYSNEVINTGIQEIDQIYTQFQNQDNVDNDALADNTEMYDQLDQILDPNSPADPFSLSDFNS